MIDRFLFRIRAFETVIDHMEQNAKNIDALRLKVEAKHSSAITDKEIEARAREQQLKTAEERLQMQTLDFERERKNLQELISRLEVHLADQTKLVEEVNFYSFFLHTDLILFFRNVGKHYKHKNVWKLCKMP